MNDAIKILNDWITLCKSKKMLKKEKAFILVMGIIKGSNITLNESKKVMDFLLDCKESEDMEIVKAEMSLAMIRIRDKEAKQDQENNLELF